LGLSNDPIESFKLFQGVIKQQYDQMAELEEFVVLDATKSIEEQQQQMRDIVNRHILREFHPPVYLRKASLV